MMITAISSDPPVSAVGLSDLRNRLAPGERSLLPTSAPPAARTPGSGEDGTFGLPTRDAAQPAPAPDTERSTIFAAAVLAGALSPTPQTMDELIMRIGSSPIPAEYEARLKDLKA